MILLEFNLMKYLNETTKLYQLNVNCRYVRG